MSTFAASCPRTIAPPLMRSLTGVERSSSPLARRAAPERRPWHVPLPPVLSKTRQRPTPYHKNLTPLPSPLRPHCPANQRLCLWRPLAPRAQRASQYSEEDLEHIEAVMARAWEVDTHATYASGLLNFMVFCDMRGVPEADSTLQCPTYSCRNPAGIQSFQRNSGGIHRNSGGMLQESTHSSGIHRNPQEFRWNSTGIRLESSRLRLKYCT